MKSSHTRWSSGESGGNCLGHLFILTCLLNRLSMKDEGPLHPASVGGFVQVIVPEPLPDFFARLAGVAKFGNATVAFIAIDDDNIIRPDLGELFDVLRFVAGKFGQGPDPAGEVID